MNAFSASNPEAISALQLPIWKVASHDFWGSYAEVD